MGTLDGRTRLDGLQAGRALAALMVVAFHANVFILPERLHDGLSASRVFNMGYAGVEFFFVLSGFIMYHVHRKDFSRPNRAREFLRRRIVRIYPIYLIIFGALLALYLLVPGRGPAQARDPLAILTSMLLLPMPEPPILRVAWTLQHEMLFYLVFAVSILDLRSGMLIFGLWMAGCLAAAVAGWGAYPLDFLLSAYNLLFLFGIGAALTYRHVSIGQARALLVLGSALFLFTGLSEAFGLIDWTKAGRTWSYGLGAATATAALAAGAVAPPRWLTFVGDASYSIYLIHLPAMSFLTILLLKVGAPWGLPPILSLVALMALASLIGCCVYAVVERPLLKRLSTARQIVSAPSQGA